MTSPTPWKLNNQFGIVDNNENLVLPLGPLPLSQDLDFIIGAVNTISLLTKAEKAGCVLSNEGGEWLIMFPTSEGDVDTVSALTLIDVLTYWMEKNDH